MLYYVLHCVFFSESYFVFFYLFIFLCAIIGVFKPVINKKSLALNNDMKRICNSGNRRKNSGKIVSPLLLETMTFF